MRQALLLIETKGKPAERVFGDYASASSKWKAVATPDTHVTLFELRRCKHKHIAAVPPPPKPAAPAVEPKPEPQPQPKQTKKN